MITDTIQNALKRLFCSIGGNADNVRNKDDINAILDEMTALNIGKKISGSSGGGVLVVHVDENDTLDKTWQEIMDASLNGVVILVDSNTTEYLTSCAYVPFSTPPKWTVKFNRDGLPEPYATEDGADGYPVYSGT